MVRTPNRLWQPYVVGCLVAGIIVGPSGIGLIEDEKILHHPGSIGVLLLLFFVGMELSPIHLITGWRISLVGTVLQILEYVGIAHEKHENLFSFYPPFVLFECFVVKH